MLLTCPAMAPSLRELPPSTPPCAYENKSVRLNRAKADRFFWSNPYGGHAISPIAIAASSPCAVMTFSAWSVRNDSRDKAVRRGNQLPHSGVLRRACRQSKAAQNAQYLRRDLDPAPQQLTGRLHRRACPAQSFQTSFQTSLRDTLLYDSYRICLRRSVDCHCRVELMPLPMAGQVAVAVIQKQTALRFAKSAPGPFLP